MSSPNPYQSIIDLLAQSRSLLIEINSASEDALIADIDNFINKQSEFEQKFESAQSVFLSHESEFAPEELTAIINGIKKVNSLLYDNDKKVKQTTKKVQIKNLTNQINQL